MPIRSLQHILLTLMALLAFAGNSVLCRLALTDPLIDPLSFTLIRLVSGAIMLLLLTRFTQSTVSISKQGNWPSSIALLIYALAFSIAYQFLDTATGALILFASVQLTMLTISLFKGYRFAILEWIGLGLALAGFAYLMLPGLQAPSILGSAIMTCAGIAWGVYSIRGASSKSAIHDTAGNFIRTLPLLIFVLPFLWYSWQITASGAIYAILSGAITSGLGYAIWYAVLPHIRSSIAAVSQLSVPVIAALGGVLLVGETLSANLIVSASVILGGILLVVFGKSKTPK